MNKALIFSDDDIKKFVAHFTKGNINQFAYVVIDKVFEDFSKEERDFYRERILNNIEGVIYKNHKLFPKKATDAEKAVGATKLASKLYVKIKKMIEDGQFKTSSSEK